MPALRAARSSPKIAAMDPSPTRSGDDDRVLFDAVLTPHRSLSPLGFLVLMTVLVAVSFLAGVFFFLAGAWPVVGFLGLDVLLVYIAFRVSYRRARAYETLHLTRHTLTVCRVDPAGGERRWQFTPAWLQVLLDDRPARAAPLTLRSHGKSLAIGGFLTAEERRGLAKALTAALAEARSVPQNS
jgi:uncharacterized membrane protein